MDLYPSFLVQDEDVIVVVVVEGFDLEDGNHPPIEMAMKEVED